MFHIGQVVRLNRGWTPMIVIGIESTGRIIAKYANNEYYPVTQQDFENPYTACSTQKRHHSGFTAWDGKPINMKVHATMTNRFKSRSMPDVAGSFLNTTSRGDIVIEDDKGGIHVLSPNDAARDIPFTFEVKAAHNNYRCHYTLPDGASVDIGDTLVSKSGNFYNVIAVDTEHSNPKGKFKGHRVVKQEL